MPKISEIIHAIEQAAPLSNQENWDNSGLIVAEKFEQDCSGVMLCLDVTPSVVKQAIDKGCNLVISHHPLIFKGIKALTPDTLQGQAILMAVRNGVCVYSSHTALDNAPENVNVSAEMARMAGCSILQPVSPTGTGVLAETNRPMSAEEFCALCAETFTAPHMRHSRFHSATIRRVVFGSGACGFLIPEAITLKADAIVTSDVRYHDFLDHGNNILIVDLTHFDTEKCTKHIFQRIISQNFTNFAHLFCASETNPIEYL